MDSRKLERILALILALLNVFLLAVVLADSAQTRRSNAETAAALTALLEENGFAVSDGAIVIRPAPPKCILTRDLRTERRNVTRLIGKASVEDLGGNIYMYVGTQGKAQLRGSGELDVMFQDGNAQRPSEKAALRLLRRSGFRARSTGLNSAGADTLEFYAEKNDIPVYNAVLRFTYFNGTLGTLNGICVFDGAAKEETGGFLDSVSVLIRFVELVREEGYICSRIDLVSPGYLQTVTRSGEMVLTPVWRIETDAGAFLIDAETGKAESRLS